jgi:dCTP deaminase
MADIPTSAGALLSSDELRSYLNERRLANRLIVTPLIDPQIQCGTLDIRLGTKFIIGRRTRQTDLNPLEVDERMARRLQDFYELPFSRPFVLHPHQLVLACSLEYLSLPPSLAAGVVTRSTYGRAGLISATAVHIHPCYKGCLTFELLNLGEVPIQLYPGLRVAQMVFYRAMGEKSPSPPKYALATRPEFPKMWEDAEKDILKEVQRRIGPD